jgi:hypothetical protein
MFMRWMMSGAMFVSSAKARTEASKVGVSITVSASSVVDSCGVVGSCCASLFGGKVKSVISLKSLT